MNFLSQAHVYVVRFRALPTIVETGENLPRAKPFPAGSPDALDEEIRKRRERTPEPDLGAKRTHGESERRRAARHEAGGPCFPVIAAAVSRGRPAPGGCAFGAIGAGAS